MVRVEAERQELYDPPVVVPSDLPEEELRWCTVSLAEVLERGKRLEASVFDVEGKHAREILSNCKWPLKTMTGHDGLASAYHRPRFKRVWVERSEFPIYQPSQIEEINPKPSGFISPITKTNIDSLRVKSGQILLTCSGTLGKSTFVSATLDNAIFSHDLIRITCNKKADNGFLYAFLRTKVGQALIQTNEYGAVISHIEPEHLESIPIADPPTAIKRRINNLIVRSFALRDSSNELLDKAEKLLYKELDLPPISRLKPHYFDRKNDLRNFNAHLSELDGRFDASYHLPIVDSILKRLRRSAEVTTIGDPRISKEIILPGRFARIYVDEGQGVAFFGGKQLLELDPSNNKYLSLTHHADRIKNELKLRENMILITCSGTIGKVALVPKYWEGWAANQHIMRIVLATEQIAGYAYVFLASDYGKELIRQFTYGAVVDEIDSHQMSKVPIPLLRNSTAQKKINRLALEAKEKRSSAYRDEQDAIHIMNDEVIHRTL